MKVNKRLIFSALFVLILLISAGIAIKNSIVPVNSIVSEKPVSDAQAVLLSDKAAVDGSEDKEAASNYSLYKQTIREFRNSVSGDIAQKNNQKYVTSSYQPANESISRNNVLANQQNRPDKFYAGKSHSNEKASSGFSRTSTKPHEKYQKSGTGTQQTDRNSVTAGSWLSPSKSIGKAEIQPEQPAELQESITEQPVSAENTENEEQADSEQSVAISRSMLSGSDVEGELSVVLNVNIDSTSPNGLIIKETIPAGWEVVESTPSHKIFNYSSGEIKWLFVGNEVGSMEIHYKIVRKEEALNGIASFSGNYIYNDAAGEHVTLQINGSNGA